MDQPVYRSYHIQAGHEPTIIGANSNSNLYVLQVVETSSRIGTFLYDHILHLEYRKYSSFFVFSVPGLEIIQVSSRGTSDRRLLSRAIMGVENADASTS